MRTWEQVIKFDSGLTIGRHLVWMTKGASRRKALVDISPRGVVHIFPEPGYGDMYVSWSRLKDDSLEVSTKFPVVFVYPARPQSKDYDWFLASFLPEPCCTVSKGD